MAGAPGQVWSALTCCSPWPPFQARKEGFLVWGWFPSTHNAFHAGLDLPGPETAAVGGGGGGSSGRRRCSTSQGLADRVCGACGARWGNGQQLVHTDTDRTLPVTTTCLENRNADPCETGVVPVQLPVTCSGLQSGPMTRSHKETTITMMVTAAVPAVVRAGVLGLPERHTHSEHGTRLSVECRRPQPRGVALLRLPPLHSQERAAK